MSHKKHSSLRVLEHINYSVKSHLWWQHYTNSLSMALGKKSFLIRDILEGRGQSGAMSPFPSNPRLIEWIIQNRLEQFNGRGSVWTRDQCAVTVDRDEPCSSTMERSAVLYEQSDSNAAICPMIPNWLSINRFANRATALNRSLPPSQACFTNLAVDKCATSPVTPLPSQIYQNLYYYAIQQQINASIVNKSPTPANTENGLFETDGMNDDHKSEVQQVMHQSILKNVRSRVISSRSKRPVSFVNSLAKRRPSHKLKRTKSVKKPVTEQTQSSGTEQSVVDVCETGLDLTCHTTDSNKGWEAECNCDVDDDSEEPDSGTNKCAAKSKCKKLRRNRTVFTELQLMGLERRFDSQKYLSTPDRADLARALGLTQLQVKTWYQNRRMKWKKQVMQNGCPYPPTKPKGRPKKDSIPTYGMEFTNSILCPIFATHGTAAAVNSPGETSPSDPGVAHFSAHSISIPSEATSPLPQSSSH